MFAGEELLSSQMANFLVSSVDRRRVLAVSLLLLFVAGKVGRGEIPTRAANPAPYSVHCVTNVSQFGALSSTDFLIGCNFHLTGVVTMVDTNRELVVLQDATGAVALNFR